MQQVNFRLALAPVAALVLGAFATPLLAQEGAIRVGVTLRMIPISPPEWLAAGITPNGVASGRGLVRGRMRSL